MALHENPLDLRRMTAAGGARALFDFIQCTYGPGDECSLRSPQAAARRGYRPYWHASWEAVPFEWGVRALSRRFW